MLLTVLLSGQILFANSSSTFQSFIDEPSTQPEVAMEVSSEDDGLKSMIESYVDYNLWANQEMVNWLSSASEEDLNKEIESSFSSLKETIFHIWNAEYLWLQIVKEEDYENSPAKNFDSNKEELFKGWLQASENFNEHVKSMSFEDLNAKQARSKGDGYTKVIDMIQHCMNHSTYHRGQLITMGRQVGLKDPPRTDFIYYVGLATKED